MAYETKAPQIENPEKITAKDFAKMDKDELGAVRHANTVPGGSSF